MSIRTSLALLRGPLRSSSTVSALNRKYLILRSMATQPNYENILLSMPDPAVQLITLNRPKALNALNSALFLELNEALASADNNDAIRAIVITGSDRAFAGTHNSFSLKVYEVNDCR
jgi:enoyl-CoA hydratase